MSQHLSLDLATALDIKLAAEQEAKFQALRTLHNSKVKHLTLSLDNKEKEITKLKILSKDNRRTQMIEAYKSKIKDLELIIDVLKSELVNKANMTRESVNDLIILKTISGPKRFRPLTREELEKSISDLERQLKRANQAVQTANAVVSSGENKSVTGSVTGTAKRSSGSIAGSVSRGAASSSRPVSAGNVAPTTPSLPSKAFASSGPSRVEDITQIANLNMEVASLKRALDVSHVTVDNQKEEISKMKMRISELCSNDEEADLLDRQFKELKVAYDTLSEEFHDITMQLARAVNENVQLHSLIEIEAEQNDREREAMADQCERFLRQNSVLLQKLAEIEAETDKKVGVNDNARRLSKSGSSSDVGVNSSLVSQLENKVSKLTEKLKAADSKILELESEVVSARDLKEQLRDKNIQIRELQKLVPKKEKPVGSTGSIGVTEDGLIIKELKEENEQLKRALSQAASESLSAGTKRAESKSTSRNAVERKESDTNQAKSDEK